MVQKKLDKLVKYLLIDKHYSFVDAWFFMLLVSSNNFLITIIIFLTWFLTGLGIKKVKVKLENG